MQKNKILLLGPRFPRNSDQIGGIVVLFEDLVTFCNENHLNVSIIDTNMKNYSNKIIGVISIFIKFFKNTSKVKHISLHGTAMDYLVLAPIIVFFGGMFGKKISLRKFAGSFFDIYSKSNGIVKLFYNYALKKSDYLFFETKYLVEKFDSFNNNLLWWPNSRRSYPIKRENNFNKRFVFLSQVKRTKGILELVEASKSLSEDFVIDIYGPITEEELKEVMNTVSSVSYKGVLSPDKVMETLVQYDVLVLPTYHEGEGYPGIILESFACGLPVISTKWLAIPEIVQDKYNGILVAPKSALELQNAIVSFTEENYAKFSSNALATFFNFDSEIIYQKFLGLMMNYKY